MIMVCGSLGYGLQQITNKVSELIKKKAELEKGIDADIYEIKRHRAEALKENKGTN